MVDKFAEYADQYLRATLTNEADAIRLLPFLVAASIAESLQQGDSLRDALIEVGIQGHRTRAPLNHVERQLHALPVRLKPSLLGEAQFSLAYTLVVAAGGLDDLPTAKCLHRHLPKDRRPSKDDIRKAMKKCRQTQRQ